MLALARRMTLGLRGLDHVLDADVDGGHDVARTALRGPAAAAGTPGSCGPFHGAQDMNIWWTLRRTVSLELISSSRSTARIFGLI